MAENKVDNITTKLARMSAEIGTIAKTGKNAKQGYAFIEYAMVSGKIRDLYAKYNLIIYPEIESYEMDDIKSSNGGAGYHYTLKMNFLIVNGDDPSDIIERKWSSEGIDYGDKGINKAATAGTKYFLMRLLQISEKGDDADEQSPEMAESSRKVDFRQIREKLRTLNSVEELVKYQASLNLTDKQWNIVKADFTKRKQEVQQNGVG